MKYRLKDICSITKGATGIMKADGGKYPLVALSDERRNHSEFQFDAKAVIVPLISSTGHGHASMKRVHYQEGKFALGNILCAVIPNDEEQLHPKFLHLFLQQFKETLLVPLMKGAANVSLPMNKLADVEIDVPSLERQLEIIALEEEAAEYKNELEERLIAQDGDVKKLRQAILREAMQGKLVKQDAKDGNAKDLLEKIKAEKAKTNKKAKPLPPIKKEEIPFEIPENWVWTRLGEIIDIKGGKRVPNGYQLLRVVTNHGYIRITDMKNGTISNQDLRYISDNVYSGIKNYIIKKEDLYITIAGTIGQVGDVPDFADEMNITENAARIILFEINKTFLKYCLNSHLCQAQFIDKTKTRAQPKLALKRIETTIIPLPPINEQSRIVKRVEQLMQLCDELQYSIKQSKTENEKLLQGALRDALKREEVETV